MIQSQSLGLVNASPDSKPTRDVVFVPIYEEQQFLVGNVPEFDRNVVIFIHAPSLAHCCSPALILAQPQEHQSRGS